MSFPQGPGNGNNPNPNNNRNNGNPFTNPFNRGNNGNNGKGNNNENRPIWQSPWLWGAVLVVMVVLMFQMFAGGGTKTIDTKDGFALINQGKATYAEITDNKQVVRLKLKNDYTIVIVTHNMQQAARIADYTAFFNLKAVGQPGHLEYFTDTTTMFNNPQNEEAERYVSGRFG